MTTLLKRHECRFGRADLLSNRIDLSPPRMGELIQANVMPIDLDQANRSSVQAERRCRREAAPNRIIHLNAHASKWGDMKNALPDFIECCEMSYG